MKSKIIYLDDNNNYQSPDKATKFIIKYFDEKGNLIEEEIGIIEKNNQSRKIKNNNIKVSKDILDYLDNYQDSNGNYSFRK